MKKLSVFIITLLFINCTPQKRIERLLERHPYLKVIETIEIFDTLYTPPITLDTVVITNTIDTFIFSNDRLITQIIKHFDTLYVVSKYTGDTIFYEKIIEVPILPDPQINVKNKWFYLTIGLGMAFFIALLLVIILNNRKH